MRNTAPPIAFVQDLETSLAGNLGVGVEGDNATVSGDDVYHDNSANHLKLPPMDQYGPKTRWIDIFSRGTDGCQWTATPLQPYVKLSPSTGYTGGDNGTDTRVYVSVDWTKAPAAPNSTLVTINITSSCGSHWGTTPHPQSKSPFNQSAYPTTSSASSRATATSPSKPSTPPATQPSTASPTRPSPLTAARSPA